MKLLRNKKLIKWEKAICSEYILLIVQLANCYFTENDLKYLIIEKVGL